MYDKELMPVVDELYLNDQSMCLLSMKQEGRQEELNNIFESFIEEIENSISAILQQRYQINQISKSELDQTHLLIGGDTLMIDEDIIQDDEDEPL